jgi:presenilin enhancer 2
MAKSAEKLSNEDILRISRRYFYIGCAFLPFLWLVNYIYFRAEVEKRSGQLDKRVRNCMLLLKKLLRYHLFNMQIFVINLLSQLFGLFVGYRVQWGAAADKLTVVIPRGY